jgi:Tol biopolymer transport system component
MPCKGLRRVMRSNAVVTRPKLLARRDRLRRGFEPREHSSMNDTESGATNAATAAQQPERLGSWKAIAAYVKRDVTTVQRWEKREGMPVRRHQHDKRGSVYAFRGELDVWMANRGAQLGPEPGPRFRYGWLGVAALVVLVAGAWWFLRDDKSAGQPLLNARVIPLTDFEGVEQAAAISRDGRFVAFLSDRDGKLDAWVTQVGTGEFRNLTQGKAPELLNPETRSVGFTPDGTMVTLWTRVADPAPGTPAVNMWAVPVIGGPMRNFRSGAVEMDWSSDAKRAVYHTPDPGDPTFLVEVDTEKARQIHAGARGVHVHFQVWSPDDSFIYFTQGVPPDEMDLWRMRPDGSAAERLTFHNSRVLYPAFAGPKTLFYLAASKEGAGPWLYSFDIETRVSQRISFGIEQYTSLAASADGRRLVATVERAKSSLWRVPITDGIAGESGASRIELPTLGGRSPRVGPNYLLFVLPKGNGYGIWKLANGEATELAAGTEARVVGGVSISPDGRQVAFTEESREGTRLFVVNAQDGSRKMLSGKLEVRGAPSWSLAGSIVVGALDGQRRQLFEVPIDGGSPRMFMNVDAINPLWSSDGKLLAYSDTGVGPTFEVKVTNADGTPHPSPAITLPRGSKRISFVPGKHALVVLQGEMRHVNFWYVDLDTGQRRQLSEFGREFSIDDFDVTAEGEIVFDRIRDNSDIAVIELPR